MSPILHIGPPKTASTLLQERAIPHLGRPHFINPCWSKRFARDLAEAVPNNLPADFILSDATLGDFVAATPALIADRLARLCGGGRIVYIERDAEEMFYAIYRQKLINGVSHLRHYLSGQFPLHWPFSASQFFVNQYKAYTQRGLGFFATIDLAEVRAAFRRRFDFDIVDFGVIHASPATFAMRFAEACDADLDIEIADEPVAYDSRMNAALASIAPIVPPRLIRQLTDYYLRPRLKPEQKKLLRTWTVRRAQAENRPVRGPEIRAT